MPASHVCRRFTGLGDFRAVGQSRTEGGVEGKAPQK